MAGAVRAVLCDLDDTLFDHHGASRAAIAALHANVPGFGCWSMEELAARHSAVLELLHLEVLHGRLSIAAARTERFRRLLADASAARAEERAPELARLYRRSYETSWQPTPGAVDLLASLRRDRVPVAVVTNNVVVEQRMKLARCGLAAYVDALVTSEEVGAQKPDPQIFATALKRLDVPADAAVMLGDGWSTDIVGARGAGVRAVWLNRHGADALDSTIPELRSLEPTREARRVILETET
jgi:putative hydrolase of the HAD superfamily